MLLNPEDVIKLLLAVAAGGLIGIEREFRDKAAGFRTLIFICVGACLFTILSKNLAPTSDPNRIAANIVTGIGFLGAGVILRDGGRIIGLTTAATIWVTSAVGMGIGGGQYLFSGVAVLVAMFVLWVLPLLERRIDNTREERKYEVVFKVKEGKLEELERLFLDSGLNIHNHSQTRSGKTMTHVWHAMGSPKRHAEIIQKLYADSEIKEVRS